MIVKTKKGEPWYFETAEVVRVVDADTADLDVAINAGFYVSVRHRIRIRVHGIDAWETRGSERVEGKIAKARVLELMPEGSVVALRVFKKGKYGRWVADVILDDGRDLSTLLVEEGHAEYKDY